MTFHRPRLIIVVWCFTCLLMVLRVLGAMGGWVGINFFSGRFSRCYGAQAVHVVRRKPWLPRFSTGVRPPAGTAFSVSLFLLCSCGPAASFVVRAACFNMRPLLFFSRPHLASCLISGLPTCSRCEWISSLLGSVPAFAPVELSVTFLLHLVL